jgi:hypothetical protein
MEEIVKGKIFRNIYRRCSGHIGPRRLETNLADAAISWISTCPDAVRISRNARVSLDRGFLDRLAYMLQTFKWMAQSPTVAAPQAAAGLRALRDRRADFIGLEALCKAYRSAKRKEERRAARGRPRAPQTTLTLVDSWAAHRVATELDLSRLGHDFKNCLAGGSFAEQHQRHLRRGEYEYWVLRDDRGAARCLLQTDPMRYVVEAKGQGNGSLTGCRDALIDFLRQRRLSADACDDLLSIGICDQLVRAAAAETVKIFSLQLCGTPWRMMLAPGLITGEARGRSFMIRHADTDTVADAEEIYRGTDCGNYWVQAEIRCALRRVCQESGQLVTDIRAAFGSTPPLLLEDWFGISDGCPSATRSALDPSEPQ